jgi:hypothetical protein
MAFHAKTVNMTHNLEVLGSSPGWSTLKISNLEEIQVADFSFRENNGKTQ